MKTLKVLHLASFAGNIGDNANHKGARALLQKNLSFRLAYTELEIREFYWQKRSFDQDFVNLANGHDLVMIGGGNYFELWVEDSPTGTSIGFGPEILSLIRPPVVFYGLGCDPYKGFSENTLKKFKNFLDYVLTSPGCLVSVRNDGSLQHIYKYFGKEYAAKIYQIPDGGFFTEVGDYYHPQIKKGNLYLGINLAGDMLDLRFPAGETKHISYEDFLALFSSLLENCLAERGNLHLVFIPHIFRDLAIISDLLNLLPDPYRRRRITVMPYLHGEGAQEYIFDLYRKCLFVMGMRFHATVCPLGLGVPTIGLASYPKIEDLYRELQLPERAVRVNEKGFVPKLEALIDHTLENRQAVVEKYAKIKDSLLEQINSFHRIMDHWLKKFC